MMISIEIQLASSMSGGKYSLALPVYLIPFLVYGVVRRVGAFEHRSYSICHRHRRPVQVTVGPVLGGPSNEYPADYSVVLKIPNAIEIGVGSDEPQFCDESTSSSSNSRGVPASPCNRICRYNAAFYDGLVCIGCFREAYEIKMWNSMTNAQKSMTLLDTIDRCSDDSMGYSFDGAVTLNELNHQYVYWSNLEETG
jgi:predicted Fe-S protein YdhL (DUF1289 family)